MLQHHDTKLACYTKCSWIWARNGLFFFAMEYMFVEHNLHKSSLDCWDMVELSWSLTHKLCFKISFNPSFSLHVQLGPGIRLFQRRVTYLAMVWIQGLSETGPDPHFQLMVITFSLKKQFWDIPHFFTQPTPLWPTKYHAKKLLTPLCLRCCRLGGLPVAPAFSSLWSHAEDISNGWLDQQFSNGTSSTEQGCCTRATS